MKRFIEGADRTQVSLLPDCLDDYVGEDNPVRVIDVFVERLDLALLELDGALPAVTGRPAYHPSVLLKIYIYGYLNRIASSRRLEREAERNFELMWLTGRLMPDFKTIANFRKDNGKAIRRVCRQFVVLCRELNLFAQALVAIDGSKFKAVNNRDKNFTAAKMKRRLAAINESIERYLRAMDTADRAEPEVAALKKGRLQDKIEALKQQMEQQGDRDADERLARQAGVTDRSGCALDEEPRGRDRGLQRADGGGCQHHLIVEHEVINDGLDRDQPGPMAEKAKEAIGADELAGCRRGFKGGQFLGAARRDSCRWCRTMTCNHSRMAGLTSSSIATTTSITALPGSAPVLDHVDIEALDRYVLVVSVRAPPMPALAHDRRLPSAGSRRFWRRPQERLDRRPDSMRVRRRTAEHPFGTLKMWMGATHFLDTDACTRAH